MGSGHICAERAAVLSSLQLTFNHTKCSYVLKGDIHHFLDSVETGRSSSGRRMQSALHEVQIPRPMTLDALHPPAAAAAAAAATEVNTVLYSSSPTQK